jgi:acetyl esterase/lipase
VSARRLLAPLVLGCAIAAQARAAIAPPAPSAAPAVAAPAVPTPGVSAAAASSPFLVAHDIVYLEGGDPKLQSLDVYAPPGAASSSANASSAPAPAHPVLVYVHGGAMTRGDKTEVGAKPEFFCGRGWVLVSINYRLSPAVKHPAHVEDGAAAVAWVARNIARYGGDPTRIALLGHSAGALIAALLATDERRLGAHGLGLDVFDAVVLLEGQEYDLESRLEWAKRTMPDRLDDPYAKFGSTPEAWRDLTVLRYVVPGKSIAPMLLVACGVQFQFYPPGEESKKMLTALWRAAIPAEYFFAAEKNHGGVNDDLTSGDAMSRAVTAFLDRTVATSATPTAGQGPAR